MNLKLHIKIALGYFFIVALLGVFMRMFQVVDFEFNYKNILHAHSHVALLGWVYTALTTLIYKLYLSEKAIDKKYQLLFWSTQITIIGMLLTFPFIGYALFSIVFSTLFLIASYFFVWFFLKQTSTTQKETNSYKLIRASLWFMVLSSFGPWVLGIIMNTLGSTSPWYRNAIYFYLHFQYNGWFVVALFGILFFVFEKHSIYIAKKTFKHFYRLLNTGVILTFFLSVLWMKPHAAFYVLAGIGSLLQVAVFVILFRVVFKNKKLLKKSISRIEGYLLKIVFVFLFVKLMLQVLGAFPSISETISSNLDFVIAYLHWVFLGVVTISVFAFFHQFKLWVISKKTVIIYLIAFISTEALLFYKGTVVWLGGTLLTSYYTLLFIASTIFLATIIGLFFSKGTR